MKNRLALALSATVCFTVSGLGINASYAAQAADVPMVKDGLSGVVTSSKGPEAGVWVVAETRDLPTRFVKIVVTDDQGRYVMPEMPKAKYKVWVRGYGLVDSKQVDAQPGAKLNLSAVVAPTPKDAAEYYPPNYWFSMIHLPAASEFPGTGVKGNGIPENVTNQMMYMATFKEGCGQCHSQGTKIIRESPVHTTEGWLERIQKTREPGDHVLGNHGTFGARGMLSFATNIGLNRTMSMFADWSKRIADGELPPVPPRPQGVERNVVITEWDWANNRFNHDIALTDRRNPTLLPNTPVYGAGVFTGTVPVLDPVTNTQTEVLIPGFGKDHDLDAYPHTGMVDQKGRVWFGGGRVSPTAKMPDGSSSAHPAYCSDPKDPYAKYFPIKTAGGFGESASAATRDTGTMMVYDPAQKKVLQKTICFQSHHLHFQRDPDNTLFLSGDASVIGWINTKKWDETNMDTEKSTGWCPEVMDTNGDGKITPDYTQWNEPVRGTTVVTDPKKDSRLSGFLYGVETHPTDGSVWFAKYSPNTPSGIIRFERGAAPPETCKVEYYEPPKQADGSYAAAGARGITVDAKGIVWVTFATGQIGRFDRSKCKVFNGPTAAGQQCPEGWTFTQTPGPTFAGVKGATPDFNYVIWADLYDTAGLGKDTIIVPGSNSDAMHLMNATSGKFVTFRVPYPMGFYTRNVEGRIDDAKGGWKGRGIWGSFSDVPVWHQEGGEELLGPGLVKFQVRPDPLAQ